VRLAFRKNQHESDPEKIKEQKEAYVGSNTLNLWSCLECPL
jgi:hypothetical protein